MEHILSWNELSLLAERAIPRYNPARPSIKFAWKQGVRGGKAMGDRSLEQDRRLVEQCRAGSEVAWCELYQRYVGLVRNIVKNHGWSPSEQDIEDLTQNVFLDLIEALKRFDCSYGLSQFICGVAKRTTGHEIRLRMAAMRNAETDPLNAHDGAGDTISVVDDCDPPDERLEQEELKGIIRAGLVRLSTKCRELITLREYQELPYKDIAEMLGEKVNTVTVSHKRCLEQLKAICHELLRKGCTR
jgi:RNA polymerase sigma-70 factor, ECF subfamily